MATSVQVQAVVISKTTVLGVTTLVFGLSGAQTGVSKVMGADEASLFNVGDSVFLIVT